MIPGNGPSLDGTRWIDCRYTQGTATNPPAPFLVDNKQLARNFRDLFLSRLEQEIARGKICLAEPGYISDLVGDLKHRPWVVFIEGPPRPECTADQMLKYLTRYLTGGPISNRRIVGDRDGHIHFMARSKQKVGGKHPQVEEKLPVVEFIRRWTMHILPKEFTKARWYGSWSPRHRTEYIQQCRNLYAQRKSNAPDDQSSSPIASHNSLSSGCSNPAAASAVPVTSSTLILDNSPPTQAANERLCPFCSKPMACIDKQNRPSWREVFYGPYHPEWFEWVTTGNIPAPEDPGEPPDKCDSELIYLADLQPADKFDEILRLLVMARESQISFH